MIKNHQLKPSSAWRKFCALGFAFVGLAASSAFAQLAPTSTSGSTDVINVYKALYGHTASISAATAAQMESVIEVLSGTATVAGTPSTVKVTGSNVPQNVATDIGYIVSNVTALGSQTAATNLALLLTGFNTEAKNIPNGLAYYLPAVTAAVVNYNNFSSGADAAELTLLGNAITDASTNTALVGSVVASALAVSDNTTGTAQGTLFLKVTGAANINAAAAAVAASGTTSTPAVPAANIPGFFAKVVLGDGATAASMNAFFGGYTSVGTSAGLLATTATNVVAALTNTVSNSGVVTPSLPYTSLANVFNALVASGTTHSISVTASIPGIVTGLLSNIPTGTSAQVDAARAALTVALIGTSVSAPNAANVVITAGAAATTLASPAGDAYAFGTSLMANAVVKASAPAVIQAMANDYVVSSASTAVNPNDPNVQAKEGFAEAGIKAVAANASTFIQAVALQTLNAYSGNADVLNAFAGNLIYAIDSKTPAITAATAANAALGLAQQFDTAGVTGAVPVITGSAAQAGYSVEATWNTIAQTALAYYSNPAIESGTEAAAIGGALAQLNLGKTTSGGYAALPYDQIIAYLAANPATTDSAATKALVAADVAVGAAQNASGLSAAGLTADSFVTALATDLYASHVPNLIEIAPALVKAGFGLQTIAHDLFASTVVGASATSGTLAEALAVSFSGSAGQIAYGAASGSGIAQSAAGDTNRTTIAKDVVLGSGSASAVAVSGSVAPVTYFAPAAKAVLAEKLVNLDQNYTDDLQITLNVAQGLSATDAPNIALVVEDAVGTTGNSVLKATPSLTALIDNIATNYNGSATALSYQTVASIAQKVLVVDASATLTPNLGNSLAGTLVQQEINANADSVSTAVNIAQSFASALPAEWLAITGTATSGSLYGGSLSAEVSGSVGAAIANGLATPAVAFTAASAAAASGSIAVLVAVNATGSGTVDSQILGGGGGPDLNTNLQTVAGVFAANAPATDGTSVPFSLATKAMTSGTYNALHTDTIPSIFAAFASNTGFYGSTAASANTFLEKYYGSAAGQLGDFYNLADLVGVAINRDPALVSLESALNTAIVAAVTTAIYTDLYNLGGPFALDSTLAAQKLELNALLTQAEGSTAQTKYSSITADETPIVGM